MFVLEPKSIAVVGASSEEKKLGHYIFKNLLTQGYTGEVVPVNPKHSEVLGKQSFPSVADIPQAIEMVVVVTPAPTVAVIAKECVQKQVKTLVVITAGFGELGNDEGHAREAELREICLQGNVSLVGPNCLGVLRPSIGMNASFAASCGEPGSIALISQSGAMAVALMDRSPSLGIGYSLIASIGNKAAMDECDFLEVCESDKKTEVIGMYLESIKEGTRFLETATRIAKKKPIVLIKAGVSARGSMAVASHTGALAGSSAALDAVCQATGIHRAQSTEEFLDLLRTLSTQPPLLSRNIAVVTNAGGPGVLATDAAEHEGLTLPALEPKTIDALKKTLPPAASTANPVDVLGDALADRYTAAIDACAKDSNVDGIVALLTPQVMTPCAEIAETVITVKKKHPMVPIVAAFMGSTSIVEAAKILQSNGIANFESPEDAVHALRSLLKKDVTRSATIGDSDDDRTSAAKQLLKKQSGLLAESIAADLLALYGLPVPEQAVAKTAKEASELAEEMGYPVIAKVSSPEILHKTDVGGVRANLKDAADVQKAFADITKNCQKHMPSAGINGILIQKFLPIGSEFIVGALRDPSFGPLVMVGLGGIYTELFKDTVFRVAPVSEEQAFEMLSELKSWRLLLGMRGKKQLDIDGLANIIARISVLVSDCDAIRELDLNPVLVGEKDVVIADAKIVVSR